MIDFRPSSRDQQGQKCMSDEGAKEHVGKYLCQVHTCTCILMGGGRGRDFLFSTIIYTYIIIVS